jgi:putative iron-regulated protein
MTLADLCRGAAMAAVATFLALDVRAQPVTRDAVVLQYRGIVAASYEDAIASAKAMQREIDAFVAKPSAPALQAARQSWLAAREWYGQTEAFRFYGGPIDGADGPEPRINSWPVDEAYIDGVAGKPAGGIINNTKVPIAKQQLAALNARGGQENIATGWHAIEFLLWGQDFNDHAPGNRSYEDFVDGKRPNAKRRREYLHIVTGLLIDDLAFVAKDWDATATNYRSRFVRMPDEALRRMFVGIGSLSRGEMAGERLEVPLATQDQEDEQSCFSDNTHRDIAADELGIENVWLGRFRRLDGTLLQGPSLKDLVMAADAQQAQQTTTDIAAAVHAIGAIQAPFDQEIRGGADAPGRIRIQAAVDALKKQATDVVASASALGITRLTIVNPKPR